MNISNKRLGFVRFLRYWYGIIKSKQIISRPFLTVHSKFHWGLKQLRYLVLYRVVHIICKSSDAEVQTSLIDIFDTCGNCLSDSSSRWIHNELLVFKTFAVLLHILRITLYKSTNCCREPLAQDNMLPSKRNLISSDRAAGRFLNI